MKKILSIVVMVLLGVSSVWAEQETVTLNTNNHTGVVNGKTLIFQTISGSAAHTTVEDAWDEATSKLRLTKQRGNASITFSSLDYTIIDVVKYQAWNDGDFGRLGDILGWLPGGYFSDPEYKINEGNYQTCTSNSVNQAPVQNYQNGKQSVVFTATQTGFTFLRQDYNFGIGFDNFEFTVVIPEVIDRTVTGMTTLTKLTNSDLDGGTITRTGYVPFVVKDPIDQTNPQNYFTATIKYGATGGESWTVLESGWSCVDNNATNREQYNVENTTPNSHIILVPVQYTATNKHKGTFSATVHLESKNTYNTANDDQNIQITVGDVKQEYAISWGNSWVDGGEITLFKGDTYPRSGPRGYLANTGELALGIPTTDPADSPIISFDDETGEMALLDEGTVKLTYTQPATPEYNEKVLTLTVHVVKRTPEFTLKSDEYVDGVHIFYVNHEYIPFVESSNEDFVTYPIEVTNNNSDNDQFITFFENNAITHSVPKEDIQITVHQEVGDFWNEKSVTYTIAIRENPIHVGTLCDRSMAEKFNDDNFTIEKRFTARLTGTSPNEVITLGTTDKNSSGGYVIFHFTGTPDALEWTYETTNGNATWTAEQSATNEEGSYTALGAGNTFNTDAQYLKITISGTQSQGNITSLCITEKVGVSITPNPIELFLMGENVLDATFTANISNLPELTLHLDSEDFELVLDGSTYDTNSNTLTLGYSSGLGIDKNAYVNIGVRYVGEIASAATKTCTLKALDDKELERASATMKITDITSSADVPGVIVREIANSTGIYTGTELSEENDVAYKDFPYRKKKQVDLKKTFDENGNALFDVLYIFGMTTNTEGGDIINLPSGSLPCNAKTLCYVYQKTDKRKYEFINVFDAVSTRFDHGESMNGKHLYFTGYCPFANIGVNPADEGWMYFVGGNTKVDIYLDNCTILGRYRTLSGGCYGFQNITNTVVLEATTIGAGNENVNYMSGFSSIFVFRSSSNDNAKSYKPTIHISGDNHLKGQLGYISSVIGRVTMVGDLINKEVETGIGNIYTVSSPITIKPDATGGYTNLTMDDLWPTNATHTTKEVTNGFLRLNTYGTPGAASEKVPCVDLGSEYGSLTINGGQYMLRNSAADGTYTCNMAFSYRKFSKLAEKEFAGMQVKALLSLYGFGGDETKAPVVINGGTFNMYQNMYPNGTDKNTGKPIFLGSNYYIDQENFLDLRLPAGDSESGRSSYINGGTFNGISHVVFCSQVTSSGRSPKSLYDDLDLCLQDVPIDGLNEEQNNGSVKFTIPSPFVSYYDEPFVDYNLSTGLTKVASSETLVYGGQSVNAYVKDINGEDKEVVSLLLPITACEDDGATCTDCELFEEAIYRNWVVAIPDFGVTAADQEVTMHVDGIVPTSEGGGIKYIVNQMLYADFEGLEQAEMTGDVNIRFADKNNTRGQFINADNYRIYKNLNILKSVKADRWYCFVAPYDIHEVSVIETAETTLETEEYKKDRTKANNLQAQNNLKVLYELSHFILPDPNGRATSLTLNELLCTGCLGVPGLKRIPLKHYNGSDADEDADENHGANIFESNYYLYEIPDDGLSITEGGDLNINWVEVKREAGKPLMYQGKVYAIQFPWCPMCNDWETRTYYDYWTNKMILFYGHGYDEPGTENDGQLIYGTTEQTTHNAVPEDGQAVYAGNYSFADMTAPTNAYVHDYDVESVSTPGDWFVQAPSGHKVKPTEGFMLYNPGAKPMPARISRTGQIEYDENVETGLPTIAGRTSLMLFGAYDGFEVLSLSEQLVTVYNLQGNIIFQQYMAEGEQLYVATGAGVFIVRGESETIKVMVE